MADLLQGIIVVLPWFIGMLAVLLLLPSMVLAGEVLFAWADRRKETEPSGSPCPRLAILVPAHNEAGQIATTVQGLLKELSPGDRLIVVADNCEDETARLAREAGATVLERRDPSQRGKGFAISFGVAHLMADPPEVVVLVDADCRVEAGRLGTLAQMTMQTGRPVQADYLLAAPPNAGNLASINAFAFLVRNRVRPLGLARLADVCQLTGSGMAFPWAVLRDAPAMAGNLVEDLAMGLELTLAGFPPKLCPGVRITSELPASSKAGMQQRKRWEHGQLYTMKEYVPRLLVRFLRVPHRAVLGQALDLLVPPLALLALLNLGVLALSFGTAWVAANGTLPLLLAGLSFGLFVLATALSWFRFGRRVLPVGTALRIPFYVLWKMGLYTSLLVKGRQKNWERTERTRPPQEPQP